MDQHAKSFFDEYDMGHETREAIDKANNDNPVELIRLLSQSLTAITNLRLSPLKQTASSRIGLSAYYRRKIRALIGCINSIALKNDLMRTFIGDLEDE